MNRLKNRIFFCAMLMLMNDNGLAMSYVGIQRNTISSFYSTLAQIPIAIGMFVDVIYFKTDAKQVIAGSNAVNLRDALPSLYFSSMLCLVALPFRIINWCPGFQVLP